MDTREGGRTQCEDSQQKEPKEINVFEKEPKEIDVFEKEHKEKVFEKEHKEINFREKFFSKLSVNLLRKKYSIIAKKESVETGIILNIFNEEYASFYFDLFLIENGVSIIL